MPRFPETRTTVRQQIGRGLGLLHIASGRVAAPTLTQFDSLDIQHQYARQLEGLYIYIDAGAGNGQTRTVLNATPFSVPSPSRLFIGPAFSSVPSTNSTFELWERLSPADVNKHIDQAIRRAAMHILDGKDEAAIQFDDELRTWGSFERWPDGFTAASAGYSTTLAPDGWTLSGTSAGVARDAAVRYSGRYSAKVLSATSQVAVLTSDDIPNFARFAGESATLKVKVHTTTAARVRAAIADGVGTSYTPYHDGNNGWDGDGGSVLEVTRTIDDSPTKLQMELRIESGASIAANWGKAWLHIGAHVYEFDLPASGTYETGFAYVSEAWMEHDVDGVFNVRIPNSWWSITTGRTPPQIVFERGKVEGIMAAGRQVKLIGQRYARLPSVDTDNLEVPPDYVVAQAMVGCLDALPWDEMTRSKRDRLAADAARILQDVTVAAAPDAWPVEAW